MTATQSPVLDPRDVDAFVRALCKRRAGFVPEWRPAERGPSAAVIQAYARFLRALTERINQAPEKHKLAFLEMLGVTLLPAQAARAPVVFTPLSGAADARVPARTKLGAKLPGRSEPLTFETEEAVALAGARIAQVATLWPGKDAWADHTTAALGGQPFTLFEGLSAVPHELYLAHEVHFALAGKSTVEVELQLARAGSAALTLAWEYWDGETWRGFREFVGNDDGRSSFDGSQGLTRSGVIRLTADCAASAMTKVQGVSARWIRARSAAPLPPNPAASAPSVDRVLVRTVIDRTLRDDACTDGLLPEVGMVEGQQIDFTKAFRPLGQLPMIGSALYLACAEAFGKPGATVTICFRRGVTPEEEADLLSQKYEGDVDRAHLVELDMMKIIGEVETLLGDISGGTLSTATTLFAEDPAAWLARVKGVIESALSLLLVELPMDFVTLLNLGNILDVPKNAAEIVCDSADLVLKLVGAGNAPALKTMRDSLRGVLDGSIQGNLGLLMNSVLLELGNLNVNRPGTFLGTRSVPDFFKAGVDPTQWVATVLGAAQGALATVTSISQKLTKMLETFSTFTPTVLAHAKGVEPPALSPPTVAWEYWNGARWVSLVAQSDSGPVNFTTSGDVEFEVPSDWATSSVADQAARWLRVRLVSGSYGRLRVVSWKDENSGMTSFMPVIEPRAPLLDALSVGYFYRSPTVPPEHCITYNDFRWADHSDAARWRGGAFEPFTPVEDRTPALYLGFDRPLPADRIGLYLDVREIAGDTDGPALSWEHWTGTAWVPVPVQDGTRGLALPGTVALTWPTPPPARPVPVIQASGNEIGLADPRDATRFFPGDELFVEQDGRGELLFVAQVRHDTILTRAPLDGEYGPATLGRPSLPRFGVPRAWLRARLRADGIPRASVVDGVYLNAVWAAQMETIENELLGSSTAQVQQTLFFRRTPVLAGEIIEIRELDGPRAHVEWPMLLEELAAAGVAEADVRLVRDRQTMRVTEVWVPWSERPTLAFSGPAERHYVLERVRGRLMFGDDVHGRVPPAGADNIRARRYRSGGGTIGNVGAGAIEQVLAGVVAQRVSNPRAAEGGAESETVEAVSARGPHTVRHRRQAISLDDYESLAREASPAVAVVRALPNTHPSGRDAAGWVTVVVMPRSADARPRPSFELREQVRRFLAARSPASVTGRVAVIGPEYLAVGVEATIVPLDPAEGGVVRARTEETLSRFFHPLTGGPDGRGWPFGRDVHLSDVAASLEGLEGVDYAANVTLLVDGISAGDHVVVPRTRIVVAGTSRIRLGGG